MSNIVNVTPKQLAIYNFIADGTDRLKDIASWLEAPLTTVQRHTDALKLKGLIKTRGQRYVLTDKRPGEYVICPDCIGNGVILVDVSGLVENEPLASQDVAEKPTPTAPTSITKAIKSNLSGCNLNENKCALQGFCSGHTSVNREKK